MPAWWQQTFIRVTIPDRSGRHAVDPQADDYKITQIWNPIYVQTSCTAKGSHKNKRCHVAATWLRIVAQRLLGGVSAEKQAGGNQNESVAGSIAVRPHNWLFRSMDFHRCFKANGTS